MIFKTHVTSERRWPLSKAVLLFSTVINKKHFHIKEGRIVETFSKIMCSLTAVLKTQGKLTSIIPW